MDGWHADIHTKTCTQSDDEIQVPLTQVAPIKSIIVETVT